MKKSKTFAQTQRHKADTTHTQTEDTHTGIRHTQSLKHTHTHILLTHTHTHNSLTHTQSRTTKVYNAQLKPQAKRNWGRLRAPKAQAVRVASGQRSWEGGEAKAGIAAGMGIVKVKAARWQQKAQKAPPPSPSPSSKLPQNLLLLFYINSKCAKIKQTKCRAGAWGKGGWLRGVASASLHATSNWVNASALSLCAGLFI